jgi:predicted nucleotidyltransferase
MMRPMAIRPHALSPEIVADLVSRLAPVGLWVFGSQVGRGQLGPGDVDLGWLAGRPVSFAERLALESDAGALVGRDVDLVVLDDASPVLVRQVLLKGVLLHASAPSRVAAFVADHVSRYADLIIVRKSIEDAMLKRITDARP